MRVFLSFHVPEEASRELLSTLNDVTGFTPYPPDTLHVTLKFIGDLTEAQIERLDEKIRRVASRYAPLAPLEFEEFFTEDNRLRARVSAGPALLQLQGEICTAVHEVSDKVKSLPYVAHVTLGAIDQSFSLETLPETRFSVEAREFFLFESVPHEGTMPQYEVLRTYELAGTYVPAPSYHTIVLPTRPQPDTIIAIFIMKRFGESWFPNIGEAGYAVFSKPPEGETVESLLEKGFLLIDVGGDVFDHHGKEKQTTASNLVAEYLGARGNQALSRLLQFAMRDDFYGKGTMSTDPLDRAFGLSGLIGSLNKKYVKDPERVIELTLPLIEAFYEEEGKRAFEMPKELEEKKRSGKAQEFSVRQRGKNLRCILIETDNTSMAGFLRSRGGGGYDVVAIRLPSGHTNILTKQMANVDLRSLALLIRIQESEARGDTLEGEPETLSATGTLKEVPEWYYDPATNSLLNGGPNPQGVAPTGIDPFELVKILEIGLSERLWVPNR